MTAARAPIHLADALDRNLLDPDDVEALIYLVGEGDLARPTDERIRLAAVHRASASCADRRSGWEADLIADPSLLERILPLVDPITAIGVELEFDQQRRPFPLEPELAGKEWCCACCGSAYDENARAVVVRGREGYSDLERPIRYCAPCIERAAEAVRIDA
jgi:hypothetical protein